MLTFIGRNSVGAADRTDIIGLSTDDKPTAVGNGSSFIEMDTGSVFLFDKANSEWHEQ